MVYCETMYTLLRELLWGERAYLTYWYAFLLSFPFSWRKVISPSVTGGSFNEYLDLSLYVGDSLILVAFILILKHENSRKSILSSTKMFHVEHWLGVIFVLYILCSFFWSENKWLWIDGIVSLIRIIAILSIFIFTFKLDKEQDDCSTWNNLKYFTFIIALSLLLQSFVGISQFIHNRSIGLGVIGESSLNQYTDGVAKIDFDTFKQIRAYGTFLHPNVFSGYLVVSILFVLTYLRLKSGKMFHVEQFLLYFSVLLATLGLIFTFSKIAIVSFCIMIGWYLFHVEQIHLKKMFHVEHLFFLMALVGFLLVMFILGRDQILKSIYERLFIFHIQPIQGEELLFGKGMGQSVYALSENHPNLENWQLQPIHNVYLLIIYEIGLFGFSILSYLIFVYIQNVPRGTSSLFYVPILIIGTIAIFDHYLWDIYVGQVLLALGFGWTVVGAYIDIDKNQ